MSKKVFWITFIVIVCIMSIGFIFSLERGIGDSTYEVHRQCISNQHIEGVDVSYYQKDIDWKTVKESGIEFGFARASDGITKMDPQFVQNWVNMKDAAIIRGAYQFFRPNQDPVEQAQLFLTIIDGAGGLSEEDLPGVIDVEVISGTPSQDIIEKIMIWINVVEQYTGKKPIIYTGPYFWELNNLGDGFKEYPLWTAHYTKKGECPLIPDPWNNWTFWQFTGSGEIKGIKTIVDINIFDGTRDNLIAFIKSTNIYSEPYIEPIVESEEDGSIDVDTKEDVNIKDVSIDDNHEENKDVGCECGIHNIHNNNIYYLITTIIGGLFLIKLRSKR